MNKCAEISDTDLAAQLTKMSPHNIIDDALHISTDDEEGEEEKEMNATKLASQQYFTTHAFGNKHSPWWEGFRLLVPRKHPELYTEYVHCTSCSNVGNQNLGLVKIGVS